jgi:predicted AlkP superfamily pyrophosphatase or phosphodiesterase
MKITPYKYWWSLVLAVMALVGCQSSTGPAVQAPAAAPAIPAGQNVVVVVIDGVRYADSWGDPSHKNVPNMARELVPKGAFYPAFYNQGVTLTNPGHVALTTGHHQNMSNDGTEIPELPSIFHYYRQHTGAPATDAWIITSKDKLEILARTKSTEAAAAFAPAVNCGVKGLGTGYRDDTTTLRVAKQLLTKHQPRLVLINLREPDSEGHAGNWEGYINAIQQSDKRVTEFWKWLQTQPHYKNTTTLFITNDHGRHTGTGNRFKSHGDSCEGCRRISLLVLGPQVKAGKQPTQSRSQVDVTATIAQLLQVPMPKRDGEPMAELFQ